MPENKKYKVTDHKTGDTFTVSLPSPPTKKQLAQISDMRAKTKRQGELARKAEREGSTVNSPSDGGIIDTVARKIAGPTTSNIARMLSAPSEAIAPEVMAPEEVEKLPTSTRLKRLGQEGLATVVAPENLAIAPLGLTGIGAAAIPIAYAGLMGSQVPETAQALYEHPSLETAGRAAMLGGGLALTGYGASKVKYEGLTPWSKSQPKVAPPKITKPPQKLLGAGDYEGVTITPPPAERLALNPKTSEISGTPLGQKQLTESTPVKRPIEAGPSTEFPPTETFPIETSQAPSIESNTIPKIGDVVAQESIPQTEVKPGELTVTPPEEMVTLYRAESTPTGKSTVPSWINDKDNPGIQAGRRWFTSSLENAEHYQKEAGETGRIVSTQVPRSVWEEARKNQTAQKYSRRPEEEGFIPEEYVSKSQEHKLEVKPPISPTLTKTEPAIDYGKLVKSKTSALLRKRESAIGKEKEAIDNLLKKRGALPDETEIPPQIEPEVKSETPKISTEKVEVKHPGSLYDTTYLKEIHNEARQKFKETNERMKERAKVPQKPKEIENTWLREQDTTVLEAMREGSTGQLREEIDSVLGERKLTKEGRLIQESTKVESKVKPSIEIEEEPKLDAEKFTKYSEQLESTVPLDHVETSLLREIAQMGKDAGLDIETVVNDIVDNTPLVPNNVNRAWAAANRVFRKGEAGFSTIDFLIGKAKKRAKTPEELELLEKTKKDIGLFNKSVPIISRPEQTIGKMGEAGLKLERMIEDAQYLSDSLKGKVNILVHDAFKDLTPKEIGQRIATLSNGKEVILNEGNFDKYVDWKDGEYTAKKGVQITKIKGSLASVILDNMEPANTKIAHAAQLFRQAMDILGTEGEQSNVSMINPGGKHIPFAKMGMDYWPRTYTEGFFESLKKNPKDWNRIVKEVAQSKGISLKEAEIMLNNPKLYGELTTRGQHQRIFRKDSFVLDPEAVYDHIHNFSGRIGMAKAFGPEDIMGSKVNNELIKLVNEGFDKNFASDTISRLVGREGTKDIPTAREKNIYRAVTNLNNARLMPSFILHNLSNSIPTAARVGPVNTIRGLMATLGNLEMSRRMATLSGATEHTGVIEGSGLKVAKLLGIPMSERFMRTWADQSGRITANGLISHLNEVKPSSPEFIRGKKLLDSLLGKDSAETIERGVATPEELSRAGWQLAKDSQGIVNPATMQPLGEAIQNPGMRLGVNLAMQYKRMAMLGMNSLIESIKLNPTRTISTLAITAPIIGEVIGDAGSALFGGLAGAYTGEGAIKGAIRDVNQRGESLAKMLKPLLQDRMKLNDSQAKLVSRFIDDLNRGF